MTRRNKFGYSLLELMSTIVVLSVVITLLYNYQKDGWNLFYNAYFRGISQIKAKLAIQTMAEELREANRRRISIGQGITYGIPFPDDADFSTPYIYFTKPKTHEDTGDVIGYDYILYYFATVKSDDYNSNSFYNKKLVLKYIRFIDQSKFYTEDPDKEWPFQPPLIENYISYTPEDEAFIDKLSGVTSEDEEELTAAELEEKSKEQFLDHYERLKQGKRNISVSGGFNASTLIEPFSKGDASFSFGDNYKASEPIMLKVEVKESDSLIGFNKIKSEFETTITPRN